MCRVCFVSFHVKSDVLGASIDTSSATFDSFFSLLHVFVFSRLSSPLPYPLVLSTFVKQGCEHAYLIIFLVCKALFLYWDKGQPSRLEGALLFVAQ